MTQQSPHEQDTQFEDCEIRSVESTNEHWVLTYTTGWSFCVAKAGCPIEPKPGMVARQWGRGIGYVVRGMAIDGQIAFYRTEDEEAARHRIECEQRDQAKRDDFELNRASMDMRFDALPQCFQDRITRFRTNNPDFRWEYEPYEMMACEDAVKIARVCGAASEVEAFSKLAWDEQVKLVPTIDRGHSGNSFGMAVRLAHDFLTDEDRVRQRHGALAPLVGSEKYGCVPRTNEVAQ